VESLKLVWNSKSNDLDFKLGMGVHIYKPSIQEVKAGGL
jgi:hypothetical protein